MKPLELGDIKIPATEYASQGNALLGIRASGKTYGATTIAEQLLDRELITRGQPIKASEDFYQ